MHVHCSNVLLVNTLVNEAVPMVQSISQPDSCKCTVNTYLVLLQPNIVVVDLNGRVAEKTY